MNKTIKTVMPIGELKNNPNNPRILKDDKFKKLVKSIQEFPEMLDAREVVVNKDHIILGGNMRFKAAKEAGIKEIPVKIVDWDEDKQRQFVIKDNVSGGEWDWDQLANEWEAEELDSWGLDVPADWGDEKEIEEDEAPEVDESEPPKSKLGEIYQLGRHRVMCGDSSDYGSITDLLNGEKADALITDPPYGIGIDGQKLSNNNANPKHNRKAHDFRGWDNERPSDEHFDLMIELGLNTVIWGGNYFADLLPATRGWLYWDKGQDGLTMSDGELAWTTMNKPLRAVTCNRANLGDTVHPTQKPLQVVTFSMDYVDANIVLDLFLGSGSTLIACEQTDRTCYGMELDPKYVDVIRKRYHKFVTGSEEGWEDGTPAIGTKEASA